MKNKGTPVFPLVLLDNMKLFLWPHTYKKGEIILQTSKEWACSKRNAPRMLPWQSERVYYCYPACCWHYCKQTSARFFWPRELMYILSMLSTLKSWDSLLKTCEGKLSKKEAKKKSTWFNRSTSLLHPDKHTFWEPTARGLNCWSQFPMNS